MASRKLITLSVLAAATASLVAAEPPEQGDDEPKPSARLTLSSAASETPPVFDLGKVIRGDEVPITFELENDAEEAVTLTALRPGCVCTTIDAWPPLIEAGERGVVRGRFSAPSRAGVRREGEVGLYDGGTRLGAVTVVAEIVDPIQVEVASSDEEIIITLRARDERAFTLLAIEPEIQTALSSDPAPTHTITVRRAQASAAIGHYVLRTNHPRQRAVLAALPERESTTQIRTRLTPESP